MAIQVMKSVLSCDVPGKIFTKSNAIIMLKHVNGTKSTIFHSAIFLLDMLAFRIKLDKIYLLGTVTSEFTGNKMIMPEELWHLTYEKEIKENKPPLLLPTVFLSCSFEIEEFGRNSNQLKFMCI